MPDVDLARRVEMLEETLNSLRQVPDDLKALNGRMTRVDVQMLQLRTEMREEFSAVRGEMATKPSQRGMVISVFSSKGGTGKTFLTTNLASAIAELSGQDTAVVDLDVDMGDVFSYFGTEPSKQVIDLISLGEGADRDAVMANAQPFGDHLFGFGAVPDPATLTRATRSS